ncbi:MAG: CBS domain-containing protein [Candidatus Scalindua sp. AMX11]|nr:MAG: CBS domain-containing protein [Candidatus Scalindua sp.]NOG84945.1 chloride channel protein [Planctomycetota bacterium]RZV85003.1 MAG: CBS domain-containing protein [Candidatus Scalindua sp. SCAELEC01]TDE63906.1 MAG: CBS domain-containing protein [Candidatus Scalindua sp. AMX11]GJQ60684.1 MAG: Cl- channel voltage-gated family protein [Candidatus Scalindua sp.]
MRNTENKKVDDRIEAIRKKILFSLRLFFSRKIKHRLNYQPFSEPVTLAGMATLVGVASATGVWLFKQMFSLPFRTVFGEFNVPVDRLQHNWIVILLPALGGIIVGLIAQYIIGKERYPGIAGVMEASALNGGRLEYRKMPVKTVASAVSIGSGASVGHGDPSVQIGATLGSMFGRFTRFSDERVRSLVAAGAAAGIAASFNAPIAGLFFALEIIIGKMNVNSFGVVALASVISSAVTQAISGNQPAFQIPEYALNSLYELPFYLGLGILAGPCAAFYIYLHHFTRTIFDKWRISRWIKPAIAGLTVGIVGFFLPQIFGAGHVTIEDILNGESFSVSLLLFLVFAKLALTPVCIGSGFYGGVFTPALFSGAALGGAYGLVIQQLFPFLNISPSAFAMVGMAAVLAGTIHAPITSFILLFEMTQDYRIILPLMFAVNASLFLSRHLQNDSVYTLGLTRRGIRLKQGRDINILDTITVGEVMVTDVVALQESDSLEAAIDLFMRTRNRGLPVVNKTDELIGILTAQDIGHASNEEKKTVSTIGEVCTRDLLVAYPDETIGEALQRIDIRNIGQLPVVSRNNPHRLVGLLRNTDIGRAYDLALTSHKKMRETRLGY